MRTIHKYCLPYAPSSVIAMPRFAILRQVHEQDGRVMLWAEVDAAAPPCEEERTFLLIGTGFSEIDDGMAYIGTVHVPPYVWHIYERVARGTGEVRGV